MKFLNFLGVIDLENGEKKVRVRKFGTSGTSGTSVQLEPDLNYILLLDELDFYHYKIFNINQSYSIKLTTHLFVSAEIT